MKKLTEKQKKFVKKAAIIGSGILTAYLAYKAGKKDGFEDGCFYAADCFTNELMSGIITKCRRSLKTTAAGSTLMLSVAIQLMAG